MWSKILAAGKKFIGAKAIQKGTEAAESSGILSKIGQIPMLIGCTGVSALTLLLITPLIIFVGSFGTIFLMQGVDPNFASASTGVDLNYDFEDLYSKSVEASISPNSPVTDLAKTEYKDVEGFNEHIKECVEKAGYGTRSAVVAAGKCLVSDYIESTGYRLRYSMDARGSSEMEGILDDTYFDCSSFAWWALYNGGFKLPCYNTTPYQVAWAQDYGIATKNYREAEAGDYLIYDHGGGAFGHARLIIGTYDDGVYIAEFSDGGQISKTPFDYIDGAYYLVQMEKYYSDSSNLR